MFIKKLRYLIVFASLMLLFSAHAVLAQTKIVVAADGSGDFRSIQAAINSLPDSATVQRIIYIRKGIYNEKVSIEKNYITLSGEDMNNTVITCAEGRDIFKCSHPDDWGVATLNLKGSDIDIENLTVLNTYGLTARDTTIICPTDTVNRSKPVKKGCHQMALRSFNTTRLRVINCTFRAYGGDTVSPWNTEDGMFYFKNCTMEGWVDFFCPRGWSLAEDCKFICHSPEAAIWHDGSKHESSKTVLLNCSFTGDDGFKLGRYHRDAQFYLINCTFPENMADADIYQKAANPPNVIQWGKRVYYYNCHRQGGDYEWHKNNFSDTLGYNDINRAWVYDYKWNPVADTSNVNLDDTKLSGSAFSIVADNMLLYQRKNGGWPKHFQEKKVNYSRTLSEADLKELKSGYREGIDATIDNDATTKEMKFLIRAFSRTHNVKYLTAVERGLDYLLEAQYKNGGWPQFYPDFSSYRNEITYNDNAMVNVLNILQDVVEGKNNFNLVNDRYKVKCAKAVQKGVRCILKTQIRQNNILTAWCAQYNATTLEPAPARKFELVSISGSESVGIVRFLMRLDSPTLEIRKTVNSAVVWFKQVKIPGYDFIQIKTDREASGRDRVLVADSNSVIWARFYNVNTNKPFFTGRDGIARNSVAEIENERRVGYMWYGKWPAKLLDTEYPLWQTKWSEKNGN